MVSSTALLWLAVAAVAVPLQNPDAPEIEATFNLFAYGDFISGLPVYYADSKAEIGDPSLSQATIAQPIYFTASDQAPSTWIAHPNTTEISVAAFTSNVMYLSSSSDDLAVRFGPSDETDKTSANVFSVYGAYVIVGNSDANFYAEPTGVDGVYSLLCGSAEEVGLDKIPLILRTSAPATESVLVEQA